MGRAEILDHNANILIPICKKHAIPEQYPFEAKHFSRIDRSPDTMFYSTPRFVHHIDDEGREAISQYHARVLKEMAEDRSEAKVDVLDVMSSWVTHMPKDKDSTKFYGKFVGLGLNQEELDSNPMLKDGRDVVDLNAATDARGTGMLSGNIMPYDDGSFDMVTCALSVDYLSDPLEVMKDLHRVLRPQGRAIFAFTNRLFPTKATLVWRETSDHDHCWLVATVLHFAGFKQLAAFDVTLPNGHDPVFVVTGVKE
eukprot:Clim_evm48s172 gene=Clim_evmTU48s172